MWVTISLSDLGGTEVTVYKQEAHRPKPLKGIPWLRCSSCGLLYLKNDVTKMCIKLGCYYDLHATYKAWRNTKNVP